MCSAKRHVRFTPKADMCGAKGYVRFVPKADILEQAAQTERPPRDGLSESDQAFWITVDPCLPCDA